MPVEWIVNPKISATSPENRAIIQSALQQSNVAFGLHRWYYGGSGPDLIAITNMDRWDEELRRGRPGDNLMLVSLVDVEEKAIAHLGNAMNSEPLLSHETELERAWAFLESTNNEVIALTRHVNAAGNTACSIEILWDPDDNERSKLVERWRLTPGELWLFGASVIWQDDPAHHELPRTEWRAQHGQFLLDVYIADADGNVPNGGAY